WRVHRRGADTGRIYLLVPQDCDDAGGYACSLYVDRTNARMRVRRAHEHAMHLVRLRRILDEAPAPANQRVVLHARLEMTMLVGRLVHAAASIDLPVIPRG